MKLLYILSGYLKIYDYLDQSIQKALTDKDFEWIAVQPWDPIEKLDSIVTSFQPDIVFTLLGNHIPQKTTQYFKEKNIKLAVWLTEDPFYIDTSLTELDTFDFIFTIDSGALNYYTSLGYTNVYHLPLATNTTIFKSGLKKLDYKSEILFIGYPYPNRVKLIHFLLEKTPYHYTIIGQHWRNRLLKLWRKHPRIKIIEDWIPPQEVALYYNNTNLILNPHRSYLFPQNQNENKIKNNTINNRTFDIAACKGFQIIEEKRDLYSFFDRDEILFYQSFEDCSRKISIYLNDTDFKELMVQKAQKKVLKQHTFHQRIDFIIAIFQSQLH
ncbi:CgeB family protein [Bacillus gaemokensis]|uniref:Protein CgeB n=1 Tax=Bacillus gaemokensis TaxID=574375 RepID=A0A073KM16_9BACI|nr:glycosyltransferase [Bacillus gaemokensis]KEK23388.1 protein CgeB [Bacillus gaemokensis]KYG25868.1 protein CgeB [Bacillus gaemokensis]